MFCACNSLFCGVGNATAAESDFFNKNEYTSLPMENFLRLYCGGISNSPVTAMPLMSFLEMSGLSSKVISAKMSVAPSMSMMHSTFRFELGKHLRYSMKGLLDSPPLKMKGSVLSVIGFGLLTVSQTDTWNPISPNVEERTATLLPPAETTLQESILLLLKLWTFWFELTINLPLSLFKLTNLTMLVVVWSLDFIANTRSTFSTQITRISE